MIHQCQAAINAGMPIIYLETDDIGLLDEVIRSQCIVPFWYFNDEKKWTRRNDPDYPMSPANVYICNGQIDKDFGQWSYGLQSQKFPCSSFVPDDVEFHYIKGNNVKGGIPQLLAVRNYHRPANGMPSASDTILERLVAYHQVLPKGDGIHRCHVILQSPVVDIPPGLSSYVEVVTVPPLVDSEIAEIITDFAQQCGEKPYKSCLDSLTVAMRGFSARKIEELLRRIRLQCGGIFNADTERTGISIIGQAKSNMLKTEGLLRQVNLDDKEASGMELVKKWVLDRKKVLSDPIEMKKGWAIDAPKGILINGIPGTGKSLLAKTVANVLEMPLYQFDMGSVLGGVVGQSESNMRRVLNLAEALSPCVLWIDEVEKAFSSASSSGDADGGLGKRLFGNFLTWMQEKTCPCFIFATANDISALPPEFSRRGRFDKKFFTFMPSKAECLSIFRGILLGKREKNKSKFDPVILSERFLNQIIEYCGREGKFMTGADIQGIVDDAKFYYYANAVNSSSGNRQNYVYDSVGFRDALIKAIDESRTYSETDMPRVVNTLFKLAENQFYPSSKGDVVDLRKVDYREHKIPAYSGPYNGYDELMHAAIQREADLIYHKNDKDKHK